MLMYIFVLINSRKLPLIFRREFSRINFDKFYIYLTSLFFVTPRVLLNH